MFVRELSPIPGRSYPGGVEIIQQKKAWISDELWLELAPLFPTARSRRRRHPGRLAIDHRRIFTGILFIVRTGISWRRLPTEMGCGSGISCFRRLKVWAADGTLLSLMEVLRHRWEPFHEVNWVRLFVDVESPVPPELAGALRGRIPASSICVIRDEGGRAVAVQLQPLGPEGLSATIPLVESPDGSLRFF